MSNDQERSRSGKWGSVVLIGVALALGWWILRTGPGTAPVEEKRSPKIVRTISPQPSTHQVFVTAYGSVIPAREVTIEPQVSGNIVRLHSQLLPGGFVNADEVLYTIDPTLNELDLKGIGAEVMSAEATLKETQRKWEEAQRLAREQVIPVTELASLEAAVRIQEAEQERLKARQARTEELLRRHEVRTPFNAIVLDEAVDLGQRVNPGDATVTLVGADEFWVRASLSTDELRWIQLPTATQAGADVQVHLDTGNGQSSVFRGQVLQLLGDLEEVGRMARVLVRVEDPLRRTAETPDAPLLLGSYVRVEIDAGQLENVLAIDRTVLREGDRIWVVDANGRLQIRDVEVRWRKDETIYLDQVLAPGEALVVSDLRAALPGMEVHSQSAEAPTATAGSTEAATDS